jgi:galacturan 1,4-alpha-galacturonidase
VNLQNFTLRGIRSYPISITQCITFSGVAGDCNTSEFEVEDVTFQNVKRKTNEDPIASFQCSAAASCKNIAIEDVQSSLKNGTEAYGGLQ